MTNFASAGSGMAGVQLAAAPLRMTDAGPGSLPLARSAGGGIGRRPSDRRVIREPYRQAFGRERTEEFGRPAGWILTMSAIEKVFFPTALLIMIILRFWEALAITVACETAVCLFALCLVTKGRRFEYLFKGILVTPVRYALLGSELVTLGRFASDLWFTNNRKWRK
jgi:hypothetical protein